METVIVKTNDHNSGKAKAHAQMHLGKYMQCGRRIADLKVTLKGKPNADNKRCQSTYYFKQIK